MRKLLLLLFIPFLGLAQMSGPTSTDVADGEGAAGLVFLGTASDATTTLADVQVNDTIVLGLKLTNWLSSTNSITYAHIDFEYNKNAYTYIDETYMASSGNPQNNTYKQNGYKMQWNSNYEAYDIWNQWQYSSYTTNTDWNVVHLQTQVTSGDLADLDYYVKFRLKVHDAGENHDYTDNVMITMGKLDDNPNSKTYDPVYAYEKQDLSLTPDPDIDVAGISVKLEVGSEIDITKFDVVPLIYDDTNNYWVTLIQGSTFWLDVPSNGTVDITQYLTDANGQYAVTWEYDHDWNNAGTSAFKTLYEDILTISDVQLALKELGQHGAGAINAGVSLMNADVAGGATSAFGDGEITSADTYALLAHVTGIEELYIDYDMDGDIDADDANNSASYFFRTLDNTNYNNTAASWEQNGITHGGALQEINIDFTNETSTQLFAVKGTWKGDVNLSHSPDVSNSVANSAKSVQAFGQTKKVVNIVNGNLLIEEQGDKVVAKITVPESNLTAAQIRLTFDNTRLTFDSVQTDTGNTTTNFAKLVDNRVNFGSINMLDDTLDASTYTVTFSKKGIVNGVTGLIVLTNTDAADTNADRVILNIQ